MSDGISVGVKRLVAGARLPRYAHTGVWGDLAADLYAAEAARLAPGETRAVGTGVAMEFPAGYGALIEDRSGLAVRGVTTLAGVIDPGYRGEIKVVLTNLGATVVEFAAGDRIAQMRLVRRLEASFVEVAEFAEAAGGETGKAAGNGSGEALRGTAGFGSTGA